MDLSCLWGNLIVLLRTNYSIYVEYLLFSSKFVIVIHWLISFFILNTQRISWRSSKFEISWFVWTSFQTFQILFSILLIPDPHIWSVGRLQFVGSPLSGYLCSVTCPLTTEYLMAQKLKKLNGLSNPLSYLCTLPLWFSTNINYRRGTLAWGRSWKNIITYKQNASEVSF